MDIKKYKQLGRWYLDLDGVRHAVPEAAKALGVSEMLLSNACNRYKKGKEFSDYMAGILWRLENNVPLKERIKVVEGHRVTTTLVMRIAGVSEGIAHARLKDGVAGRKTYTEVMAPVDKKRSASASVAAKDNYSKANAKAIKRMCRGMQPRRSIDSIFVGKWEREQLQLEAEG